MEPQDGADRDEKRRFPVAFAAGACVVLVLLIGLWLLTRSTQPSRPGARKLPFGSAEQAYAEQIRFQSGEMSHATNFLNQEFIYIEGTVSNQGARTVRALAVTFEFRDALDQVILRDTERLIESTGESLPGGKQRDFRITFEHIPSAWTQQYPTISVAGMILE
jgi:hypothetical protein